MADAITGITEISATSMEVISQAAQSYLQQKSMLLPTVTNYSGLVIPGSDSVSIPRASGFTVGSKSENTALDAQAITFSKDTIDLDNYRAVQFLIEEIASSQARVAVVQENVLRGAADLAVDVDNYIVTELALASSTNPDNQLKFNDDTNEDIELIDILNARKALMDQYLDPRECFIGVGTAKEKDMLQISNFIDASKYGSNEPIMNGEIGKIYGMKVIVSTVFGDDNMYTYHPSAVGFAFQRQMTFQSESALAHLATRYSLDMRHGTKVLDLGKRCVLTTPTA